MQDLKRLKVGAVLGNTQSGVVVVQLVEYDGGDFNLVPKKFDGGIVLVDPNRPAAYGLQIEGTAETLKQLGNALLATSRSLSGTDSDSDDDADAVH